jgi:O-antigen ligase/polysaccharide polymerase Wzy-like membrane protein
MTAIRLSAPVAKNVRRGVDLRWSTRPQAIALAGWCLAAYTFLLPVQFALNDDLRLAPSDLFIGAYLVIRLPRMRLARAAWSGWQVAVCGVLIAGTLVALLTDDLLTSYIVVQKGFGMLSLLLTFACLVDFCLDDPQRLAWLSRCFLYGVLLNLIVGLIVMHLQQAGIATLSMFNLDGVRLSGLLVDPNAFGGLLVVAIALHFSTRALGAPLVTGLAGFLLTVLLPVGLVLTYSRSAWIGMLGAGAVGAWLAGSRLVAAYGKVVLGLGVAALLAASVVLPNASELVNRKSTADERVTIIEDGLAEFQRQPLIGIGLGVFDQRHDVIIHNTTIWFLVELGPIGLITLVGFLLAFWWKGWQAYRTSSNGLRAIVIGLMAAHVGMYGVSMGIEAFYQRHWWFVFAGLGVSYAYTRRETPSTSDRSAVFAS